MPADGGGGNRPSPKSRGPITSRAIKKANDLKQFNYTRSIFDTPPLIERGGYAVLKWQEDIAIDGTMLGVAFVRLPKLDTDLVVEIHATGDRLWAEAAGDTPPRCLGRLTSALPTLRNLIMRVIGGDAIKRMIRQREEGGES